MRQDNLTNLTQKIIETVDNMTLDEFKKCYHLYEYTYHGIEEYFEVDIKPYRIKIIKEKTPQDTYYVIQIFDDRIFVYNDILKQNIPKIILEYKCLKMKYLFDKYSTIIKTQIIDNMNEIANEIMININNHKNIK